MVTLLMNWGMIYAIFNVNGKVYIERNILNILARGAAITGIDIFGSLNDILSRELVVGDLIERTDCSSNAKFAGVYKLKSVHCIKLIIYCYRSICCRWLKCTYANNVSL